MNKFERKMYYEKIISVLLALIMIFSTFAVSVSAVSNEKVKYPIIFIAGSSVDLVDGDQNPISTGFDVLTDDDEGDITTEDIVQKTMNVLLPSLPKAYPLINGIPTVKSFMRSLLPYLRKVSLTAMAIPNSAQV